MSEDKILSKLKTALALLEKLSTYAQDLRREIDDLRRVSFEITTMIIQDAESIRNEIATIVKRLIVLEKKLKES